MRKYKYQILEALLIVVLLGTLAYMGTHEHILEAEPINSELNN